ncbi:hypothetical protein PsorP6_016611 [Peronosclerospora sorghi]|uniref:Uncharacterized protein n=1 Tax=Peronosclerospora sorghi TaxID=230839 RepID=A0ACC0VLA1_9STRA|nr:hypothetical protein PsorP6_016611 [Peronosclerospora sorghi]
MDPVGCKVLRQNVWIAEVEEQGVHDDNPVDNMSTGWEFLPCSMTRHQQVTRYKSKISNTPENETMSDFKRSVAAVLYSYHYGLVCLVLCASTTDGVRLPLLALTPRGLSLEPRHNSICLTMALPTPRPTRSRASQGSLLRLPVPTHAGMSLRSRRAKHPSITLALPQLDSYHDHAEQALSKTIEAYGTHGNVDYTRWKCLRSRHGVRLFRDRRPSPTDHMPLLCLGALRGNFDDILEGIYCAETEDMLLMNAIKCPRLTESAVLYTVQRRTIDEPYAFTGVKRMTINMSVASNRDLCYFDKMGLVCQTSGKRMAYHVMQSVELPEHAHKAMSKRMHLSVCYVLEELEDDLVGVYMQGEIDAASLWYFSTPAISHLLLAFTKAIECTRAKKFAEVMAVAPLARFRRRSPRKCCDVCRRKTLFFESYQECSGCKFKFVCKKCRLKEHVLTRDKVTQSHLMRAEFCRVCISKVDSTPITQLRAEAGDASASGLVDTGGVLYSSEVDHQDVEIPGSDRSLTAFSLKITAQMQDLSSRGGMRISNLSTMDKVSISEDEDDEALLGEDGDVLNSFKKKSDPFMVLEKDVVYASRGSSRSTTSTASSSYYHDDEDLEQYQTSLFARLLKVSSQAEATFNLAKEHSLIAHSFLLRNRHCSFGQFGAVAK